MEIEKLKRGIPDIFDRAIPEAVRTVNNSKELRIYKLGSLEFCVANGHIDMLKTVIPQSVQQPSCKMQDW